MVATKYGQPASSTRPRTNGKTLGHSKLKMEKAEVGMHVDIKRSDGRVHSAIVTELRPEKPGVMVEWFEKGQTKGKEVELDELFQLNPTLRSTPARATAPSTKQSAPPVTTRSATVAPAPAAVQPYHYDYNNENYDLEETLDDIKMPESRPIGRSQAHHQQTAPPPAPAVAANKRSVMQPVIEAPPQPVITRQNSNGRRSMAYGSQGDVSGIGGSGNLAGSSSSLASAPAPALPAPSVGGGRRLKPPTKGTSAKQSAAAAAVSSNATTPVETRGGGGGNASAKDVMTRSQEADTTITTMSPSNANGKGSTVANIEKMQKDREERRARQEREKAANKMNPKDPNYQFYIMIRQYLETVDFRPLVVTDNVMNAKILVCVRKRPMNKKEINGSEIEVITIPNRDHVIVHQPQVKVDLTKYLDHQEFRLDYAFDENVSNQQVYRFTAQPLVKTIFDKGNATCFAYGQTGSGKTHTMGGDFGTGRKQDCSMGIYALTAADVFRLRDTTYRHLDLDVYCAFFELYGGKVCDLLNNKSLLRVLEDGKAQVNVVGLKEVEVDNEDEVLALIKQGTDLRTAGTTSANSNSSRSHAVFQIILKKGVQGVGRTAKVWGKFSLVDLAGNERGQDTGNADRTTRMEGAEINKSLLALKECIRAMGKNANHVPFRTSKLTQVLRDSFVGENTRTCMIAMISPSMASVENTLNTLRYADRLKGLGTDGTAVAGNSSPIPDDVEEELNLVCSHNGTPQREQERMRLATKIGQAEEATHMSHLELTSVASQMQRLYDSVAMPNYDDEKYIKEASSMLKQLQRHTAVFADNIATWTALNKREAEFSGTR